MALQLRRGTEAERTNASFIPEIGEPIYTTDEKKIYIGDGSTPGGNQLAANSALGDFTDVDLDSAQVATMTTLSISGGVVTVFTSTPHGFSTGDKVRIQPEFKTDIAGLRTLTGVTVTSFSFEQALSDSLTEIETGTVAAEPPDESILSYDQNIGKFIEQEYVYNLDGLGDVEVSNPVQDDIIQYNSIDVGDITLDSDSSIVSSGVPDPGNSIPAGQTWTQTGTVSRFENRPFRISFSNIQDVFIGTQPANRDILVYDSSINLWTNQHYVDVLDDLADVVTNLPSVYLTEYSITVDGVFGEDDYFIVRVNEIDYRVDVTEDVIIEAQTRWINASRVPNFDFYLRNYLAEIMEGLITADTEQLVTPTRTDNKIVFTRTDGGDIRLTVYVVEPITDNLDANVTLAEPTPPQVLMHDGTNWTNGGISFNNFNINALYDVGLGNVQDGDILQYDGAASRWTNAGNFVSLTQFADVSIGSVYEGNAPTGGEGLIYDVDENLYKLKNFALTDLTDVTTDMGLGYIPGVVPDGAVLAYDTGSTKFKPKIFSAMSSRVEKQITIGPTESLGIAVADFEAFTGYAIFKLQASAKCTVTFYASEYNRLEDLTREQDTATPYNSGIFAELTPPDTNAHVVAPVVYGFNDDVPISRTAYIKVRNRSGFYQNSITITLTILQIEEDPRAV